MVSWPGRKKPAPPSEPAPTPAPSASVHFTPTARAQVLQVLAREGGPAVVALRLSVKNPGQGDPQYDMALEAIGSTPDTVIDAGGFSIVVDAASLAEVNGATVDFVDDPLRPGFRVDPPRAEVPTGAIGAGLDRHDPLAAQVRFILDQHINPGIASHGGHAELVGIQDDIVYLALGGGCQGCAMASVTLKQGIEQVIKQALPQVRAVVDATDHAHGANPYFTSAKDAESPFYQPAKA
jgi:Fe/S biogenesis protein NfuA